jgi:hypothetical protein
VEDRLYELSKKKRRRKVENERSVNKSLNRSVRSVNKSLRKKRSRIPRSKSRGGLVKNGEKKTPKRVRNTKKKNIRGKNIREKSLRGKNIREKSLRHKNERTSICSSAFLETFEKKDNKRKQEKQRKKKLRELENLVEKSLLNFSKTDSMFEHQPANDSEEEDCILQMDNIFHTTDYKKKPKPPASGVIKGIIKTPQRMRKRRSTSKIGRISKSPNPFTNQKIVNKTKPKSKGKNQKIERLKKLSRNGSKKSVLRRSRDSATYQASKGLSNSQIQAKNRKIPKKQKKRKTRLSQRPSVADSFNKSYTSHAHNQSPEKENSALMADGSEGSSKKQNSRFLGSGEKTGKRVTFNSVVESFSVMRGVDEIMGEPGMLESEEGENLDNRKFLMIGDVKIYYANDVLGDIINLDLRRNLHK